MKTHMIHCNSEFRAYALIRQVFLNIIIIIIIEIAQ